MQSLFEVVVKIGDDSSSTIKLAFNEDLGQVDTSKITISKDTSAAIKIDEIQLNATVPSTLTISKVFYWEKNVYLTVEGKLTTSDSVSVALEEGAVYTKEKKAIPIKTSDNKTKIKAQDLPAEPVVSIALSGTKKVYILYDTQLKNVADKDKFSIGEDNAVTAVKKAGDTEKGSIEKTLANYGLLESGITVDDILGYVAELTVTKNIEKGTLISATTEAAAVTSISGKKSVKKATKAIAVKTDQTKPTIKGVSANDGATTTVVVEFSETIEVVDATKFKVQVETGSATAIATGNAVVDKKDNRKVILTLATAFVEGNAIKVTLEVGAVKDKVENQNDELITANTESTTKVTDKTPPTLVSVSAGISTPEVLVTFSEPVKNPDKTKYTIKTGNDANNVSTTQLIKSVKVLSSDKKVVQLLLYDYYVFPENKYVSIEVQTAAVQDTNSNASVEKTDLAAVQTQSIEDDLMFIANDYALPRLDSADQLVVTLNKRINVNLATKVLIVNGL